MSSCCSKLVLVLVVGLKGPVDDVSEVAFQRADRGFLGGVGVLLGPPVSELACGQVVDELDQGDAVDAGVELPVPAAIEPVLGFVG